MTRLALVLLVLLGGCDEVRDLRWEYRLQGGTLRDPADPVAWVHARIRRGGCDGAIEWESQHLRGQPSPRPPELEHAMIWGFEILLVDETCAVRATGCQAVALPTDGTVMTLATVTAEPHPPACVGLQMCDAGRCVGAIPDDAGMMCPDCCAEDMCVDGQCMPPGRVNALMTGATHSCAIREGEIWCWGTATAGELGTGVLEEIRDRPVALGAGSAWEQIDGQFRSTCARRDGEVVCWGANGAGQLGVGNTTPQPVPSPVAGGPYTQISVGAEHACATTTDELLTCWGRNDESQASMLVGTSVPTPTQWDPGMRFGVVEMGGRYSCGFSGGLFCWGDDSYGTLARGLITGSSAMPIVVPPIISAWKSIAAGRFHSCATDNADQVWCWGKNFNDAVSAEQFAVGSDDGDIFVNPVQVGLRATRLAASSHTCAITPDASLFCFGPNDDGQLGSSGPNTFTPREVLMPESVRGWVAVSAGESHTCATDSNGGLWCWGANANRALGVGPGGDRPIPARVCFGE